MSIRECRVKGDRPVSDRNTDMRVAQLQKKNTQLILKKRLTRHLRVEIPQP